MNQNQSPYGSNLPSTDPQTTNQPEETKPKKGKKLLITCLVLVVLIIIGIVVFVFIINKLSKPGVQMQNAQVINPSTPLINWQTYYIPSKTMFIKAPPEFQLSDVGKADDHDGIKLTTGTVGNQVLIDVYHQKGGYDSSLDGLRINLKSDNANFSETEVNINGYKGTAFYSGIVNKKDLITYYYIVAFNNNGDSYSIGLSVDNLNDINNYKEIYSQVLGSVEFKN